MAMVQERHCHLTTLLKVVRMSRSTYYYEMHKSDVDDKNKGLIESIIEIFKTHKQNYGVRRVYHELVNQGVKVNHKLVQRVMKKLGLSALKHPQKYHSYQGHIGAVADNHLKRDFKVITPNKKWTTDISQFSFTWGKCYLSPILDMYNDEIVSHDLSLVANFNQIERMLDGAKLDDISIRDLIFHSDQGWQYQNPRYVEALKKHGIKQSMSRKGNCFDNAIMESFFGIMKNEIYYGHETEYKSFDEFQKVVNEYIDYYNNIRIKQRTAWLSPVQYRMMNYAIIT